MRKRAITQMIRNRMLIERVVILISCHSFFNSNSRLIVNSTINMTKITSIKKDKQGGLISFLVARVGIPLHNMLLLAQTDK